MAPDKSRLFDASSLVELIRHGDGAAAAAFSQYTLDLAFYEAGNSFWNDSAAQQLVSREDATDTVDYLDSIREEMLVLSLSDVGATTVFDMAWDEGVTYYDAAYITAAKETNTLLVTEDGGMADHAPETVSVATAEEIVEE
ncbi:type II toxin-antitoxin system VapC family toxin [Haladaptatus salinisoli]|uniref:type II toxin-antitoxin system VapC family toxin n=1 Tax=Haladaptatus salinisoli TaxID=2884876 RepID=UPI001D0A17E2|nr:type II toxin-antitoxin system VapC family toxin [Haladaptatus salinisoli]